MPGDSKDTVEIVPNADWDSRILVLRCAPIVDAYLIVTARSAVLVDTLINPQTARQALDVARPHLSANRTLLVVNTHADYDHCWGNQLFAGPRPDYPAPVLATHACAAQFATREAAPFLAGMKEREPERYAAVEYAPPTIRFEGCLAIEGGDLTLELFETPGHAPGHLSVWLPEIRTLLVGDAAELPFPFARSVDAVPDLRRSLAAMLALDPAIVLYSHAPSVHDATLLRDNAAYLDRLEASCRTALAAGLTLDRLGDDPAASVTFPFEEALPTGVSADSVHAFYREQGHPMQIRMMMEFLERRRTAATTHSSRAEA